MLKLIPQENPSPKKKKRLKLSSKFLEKLESGLRHDDKILRSACQKLLMFVKKSGRENVQEVSELIHSLHRSVLSLERKKMKMMREGKKKKD